MFSLKVNFPKPRQHGYFLKTAKCSFYKITMIHRDSTKLVADPSTH